MAVAALRFLYTVTLGRDWVLSTEIPAPKRPQTLPVVLSPDEVVQFLDCVKIPMHHTILTTCYAAGLRISEAIRLTVPAIDSRRMVLRVEQGKGQKDRYVMLSPKLLELLRAWWRRERPPVLALSQRPPRRAHHGCGRPACLPTRASPESPPQAGDAARLAPRVRRPPARGRHGRPDDSVAARAPQVWPPRPGICASPPRRSVRRRVLSICSRTPAHPACHPKRPRRPDRAATVERTTPTVAEVIRRYGEPYREQAGASLSGGQRRVLTAIAQCRTAALGGHVEQCDGCGYTRVWYNSCRNRHCPMCQALARATWVRARQAELLDCPYFHVVFTVPDAIAQIALQNKAVVYGILFRATADTLRTIAADSRHLGAEIGFVAVLHTWGQTLVHHPHLHCVVPGGGLSADGTRWVACRPGFFLPVRVLSRFFRRRFLAYLQEAYDTDRLRFRGALQGLTTRKAFTAHLARTRSTEWVVYAKRPFAGPQQVLDYVGRYTHRIALSNDRLLGLDDGQVQFRFKDYRAGASPAHRTMTLDATEFIRRFLLHVLPSGFHRMRYYGLLGNRHRTEKLAQCRRLLGMAASPSVVADPAPAADYRDRLEALTGTSLRTCPVCQTGHMILIDDRLRGWPDVPRMDSS